MTIVVTCPHCHLQHQASEHLAGSACRCSCGGVVFVPLVVTCTSCGEQHEVPEELAGQACMCPCGAVIDVPALQDVNLAPRSIFDELTDADFTRRTAIQQPIAVVPQNYSIARLHPAIEKAIEDEYAGYDRSRVPVQINLAGFCLAVGGGAEIVAAALAFLVMARDGLSPGPALFMNIVSMVWGMLGMMNVVVAVLVLNRSPMGQVFGLVVAVLNILSLSPRLVVASIFIIFSLASSEATTYFRLLRRARK